MVTEFPYYALLEFSSVLACFQEQAYFEKARLISEEDVLNLKIKESNTEKSLKCQTNNFFVWGFSDILRIFIFEHIKGFAELQKLERPKNVYDLKYCSGFFYTEKQFDLTEEIKEYPLIGISFLKLEDEIFKKIKTDKFTPLIFDFLTNKIKETIGNKNGDYHVFPIISYGWEDVILLFFSKSYDLIKKSIFKLRTTKITEIEDEGYLTSNSNSESRKKKDEIRHILMNTFTVFGTYFPNYSQTKNIEESSNKLKDLINKNDNAYVSGIKFQVRPGYVNTAEQDLRNKFREKLNKEQIEKIDIIPIPYRGDLFLYFREKKEIKGTKETNYTLSQVNFHKFLDFYPSIIKTINNKNTPIVSLETQFSLDKSLLSDYTPLEVDEITEKKQTLTKEDKDIIKWIQKEWIQKEGILAEHSLLGFVNLINDTYYFQNHCYIKQTMISWINTVKTLKSYLSFLKDIEYLEDEREFKEFMTTDMEIFLSLLPRTFTDRFRGVYPVGEISTTPLLTYKASLYKFLRCIDYISLEMFNDAHKATVRKKCKYPENYSFCSTFTTDFSPSIITFLWKASFLFIPDVFFYKVDLLTYLPHEIGHTYFLVFATESLNKLNELNSYFDSKFYGNAEISRHIMSEILADYFALCVGFRGNIKNFETNFPKSNEELLIRKEAVKYIYNNISKFNTDTFRPFGEEYKSLVNTISKILEKRLDKKEYMLLLDVISKILIGEEVFLKNLRYFLLILKNSASNFGKYKYSREHKSLFEQDNWIKSFLESFKKIKI